MARIIRRSAAFFLGLAALALFSGCQVQLHADLPESDANAMLAALLDAGLTAEKRPGQEGTYAVYVEEAEFASAVRLLDARGLPGKRYDDLGKVFGKVAMFSTPVEEKARYLYAMQEDLAKTLSRIDGVLDARVHLVLPEQDQLGRPLQTPSAAVFIRHVDDERHDPAARSREIRRLVSAAVPNLAEEMIAVSFFPADAAPPAALLLPPPWKSVLGVRVARESAERLYWGAGGAAAAVAVLAVLLLVVVSRKGRK